MGFLKELGGFAGGCAGAYFGGLIGLTGALVGSDSLMELGDNVRNVSCRAGKALGDVAESIANTAVSASKKALTTYSTSTQQSSIEQGYQKLEEALKLFDE